MFQLRAHLIGPFHRLCSLYHRNNLVFTLFVPATEGPGRSVISIRLWHEHAHTQSFLFINQSPPQHFSSYGCGQNVIQAYFEAARSEFLESLIKCLWSALFVLISTFMDLTVMELIIFQQHIKIHWILHLGFATVRRYFTLSLCSDGISQQLFLSQHPSLQAGNLWDYGTSLPLFPLS